MDRDELRSNLIRFTERAFEFLPPMEEPRILDIGCGSGIPTLRLAELSGGHVVGLDSDRDALEVLQARAKASGMGERIEARHGSLEDIRFQDGSFDLIWCEGAVHELGFRESIRRWRRLLGPGGCMALHDEAGDVAEKLRNVEEEGFILLGSFEVSEQIWWDEYFALADGELDLSEEIELFRIQPERFRSAFFVLQLEHG